MHPAAYQLYTIVGYWRDIYCQKRSYELANNTVVDAGNLLL